jgi:hypothetical protein
MGSPMIARLSATCLPIKGGNIWRVTVELSDRFKPVWQHRRRSLHQRARRLHPRREIPLPVTPDSEVVLTIAPRSIAGFTITLQPSEAEPVKANSAIV